MKTNEGPDIFKEKAAALNKKLAESADDALQQVTGGRGEPGTLDRIMSELSFWLEAHPNATRSDVYMILNDKKAEYADMLTVEELSALNDLLDAFIS